MESVFYKYKYKKRFPVTYLFLELFTKSLENSDADADVITVLLPVLAALDIKPPIPEEVIHGILEDLDEHRKKTAERSGKGAAGKGGKRTFGKEFIKWFSGLDVEQTLLLVTNFDYEAAYKIYSEVPISFVDKMIRTKLSYDWTIAEKDFEAVVFGMGGSIKGGTSGGGGEGQTFEAPKNKEEEVSRNAALKKLGFM